MPQKYIKILTFLGLIAIVAVQSLWLVNTYQLIDGKIRQACSRLFPKSVLDEVADRNLVLLRLAPNAGKNYGLDFMDTAMHKEFSFFGEPLWVPVKPLSGCPICSHSLDT